MTTKSRSRKHLLPKHVTEAKRLYSDGYSVVNVEIYHNTKTDKKSFNTPANCTELTYEECKQYISPTISLVKKDGSGSFVKTTNGIMLLTGIRKGKVDNLKHCICIDVDNPKSDEVDGSKFIRKHKSLFKNCYIESTANGGKHYIFLLDNDKYQNELKHNDRFEFDDKIYSIDILANAKKCILAPSRYETPTGSKYYTSENSFDDIDYIDDQLFDKLGLKTSVSKVPKLSIKSKSDNYDIFKTDSDKIIFIKIMLQNKVFKVIDNYGEWLRIATAINNEIPNSFALFHMISKQNDTKYKDENDCRVLFNGLSSSIDGRPVKWGTIVRIVKNKVSSNKYNKLFKEYTNMKNVDVDEDDDLDENEDDTKELKLLLTGSFTDVDLADYMFKLYGDEFVVYGDYIFYWNGKIWMKQSTPDSINLKISNELFKKLKKEADNLFNGTDSRKLEIYQKVIKKLIKLRNNSSKKGIIEEFILLVKINHDIFDLDPDLLGFKNGIYDLKNNEFRPTRKEDHVSLIINYDYRKSTNSEMNELMIFINSIMPVDVEKDFLLKALSSCLGGRTLENILILTGSGRNGKDTLLSYLMKEALDKDLYYYNSNTVITGNNSTGVNQEKANMDKKRCVVFSEPNKDCTLKNNTLKEISGGKQINARGLYMKNTETVLHATNIILCNKIPQLDNVDEAISQRLLVIPFRSLFRKPEDIAKLPEGTEYVYEVNSYYKETEFLKNNRLPFINLLLEYYVSFKNDGYVLKNAPESIKKLSEAYMADSNVFLNWFNDTFDKTGDKKDYVKMIDMYDIFRGSELYNNLPKKDKRGMTKKKLIDDIQDNPHLRLMYKDRIKINKVNVKNCIVGYKVKQENGFVDDDE
jgi:P4 family phage/plasmid primase-like protien